MRDVWTVKAAERETALKKERKFNLLGRDFYPTSVFGGLNQKLCRLLPCGPFLNLLGLIQDEGARIREGVQCRVILENDRSR